MGTDMYLSAEPVIREIVEQLLPSWSDDHLGLLIEVDVHYGGSRPKGGKHYEFRKSIWLLFRRPHNYTQVYVNVDDQPRYHTELRTWKLTCDHDSCWSTDGIRVLNEVHDEAMQYFEKKGVEWKAVHPYASFGISGIKYVLFYGREPLGEKDPSMSLSYHRDWSIKIEPVSRVVLRPRGGDNGITCEGWRIDPEYLKQKQVDLEQ